MEKKRILGLILAQTFIALSLGFIGPIYAIYFEKISNNIQTVSLLIGIYWIFVGILEPIFGRYIDKIGKKMGFFLGCLLTSISILIYLFFANIFAIFIAQIIAAVGYALEIPSYISILSKVTNDDKKGKEIGKIDGLNNIVYGLAAILSTLVLYYFNLEFLFIFASLSYLLAGIIMVKMMDEI